VFLHARMILARAALWHGGRAQGADVGPCARQPPLTDFDCACRSCLPSCCSFSFFILQSWIPTFLASLGLASLSSIGLLSSLPWLVRWWCAVWHVVQDTAVCR